MAPPLLTARIFPRVRGSETWCLNGRTGRHDTLRMGAAAMIDQRRAARLRGVEDICIYCLEPEPDHAACDRNSGYAHDDGRERCACWALNHGARRGD